MVKKNQLQLQMVQPFNLICLGLSTWTSATWYLSCPGDTNAKQKCWVHWSLSASLRLLWLGGFRLAMGPWTVHRKSRMFRTSFGCHFDEDEALFLEEVIVPAKQYGMDRVADDTRWSPLQIPALSYIFTIQHFLDSSPAHQFFFTIQGHEIQITCRSMKSPCAVRICQSTAQVTGQDMSTPSGSSGLLLCKAGQKNLFQLQTRCHGFGDWNDNEIIE